MADKKISELTEQTTTNVTDVLPIATASSTTRKITYANFIAPLAPLVSGAVPVNKGGTGQTTYTNGQLLIGDTTGNTLTKTTLTAGAGISITNGTGSITITALGGGGISLSDVYPVGSIYTNAAVSTNPATLLGFGTWTAFGSGRVLVGVDAGQTEFDTLGETGGSKTHTLTSGEMPSHAHIQDAHAHGPAAGMTSFWQANSGGTAQIAASPAVFPANNSVATTGSTTATNQNTGGGESHNNLQPYITVYMWRRTA